MSGSESTPLFGIARRERIMDMIRTSGAVRVVDLAREFDVSELTIRRDIGELADRGLVTRVHGGATVRSRLDSTSSTSPSTGAPRYRVAIVVPSLTYYWPSIVNSARATAAELGVQLVLRGASYDAADQRRQISSVMSSGGIQGLIVAPETQGPDGHALLTWLDELPIPVVLVERQVPPSLALEKAEWVTSDHEFGAVLAATHLASLGHRRVGIVTSVNSPTSARLRRGWDRAVAELGMEPVVDMNVSPLDSVAAPERTGLAGEVLQRLRDAGATGILIHPDPQAMLVQQYAIDQGWSVPGDLSIVAYDDEIVGNASPPITSLSPAKAHVGRRAVEILLTRLTEGPDRPAERVHVVPHLQVRESTVR
ncbi:substrate-binding domain-containing protein [Rugosimonospora africana]|uniref:LacI family transcriptional regulator n=1 Tax=Rugosimonospora africana TaxID=556532 RepID=A0A8J3R053_9ACTN|nr:substrate-binding domain-containing protein [Rugosimonospora africana]GIH19372.1 LacI family transcriptional regulator [Rugosimonospora africana]